MNMEMETLLAVCAGLGLSAACGFRVFVPLLIMSIAAHSGHLHVASSFDWIGSTPALITFSLATALEIGAYYVPWLDNFLDTIATPAAIIAGTIVTASMVTDVSPYMRWTLAAIAGGGLAAAVQGTTVMARAVSTATTGGLGNPILATAELGGAVGASVLVLFVPIAALILILATVGFLAQRVWKRRTASNGLPPVIPA
jgi:hypothetical protein